MLYIYTDGGSRGNPGNAGIGVVIKDDDNKIVKTISKNIGNQTNNYAEYTALIIALFYITTVLKATEIMIFADSQLMVNQVNNKYKITSPTIKKLHDRVFTYLRQIPTWSIQHIPREQNKEADSLANQAMDKKF